MPLNRTGEPTLKPFAEPGMRTISSAVGPPRPYSAIQYTKPNAAAITSTVKKPTIV